MAENTLDDQDIDVLIVKVRSHGVAQRVAGNVKVHMQVGLKQYFFHIVFHGANRQAIALFRDKQCRRKPTIEKQFAYSQVLTDDFYQLVIDMQGSWLFTFTHDCDFTAVKIEICKVKRMDLSDSQAELIHQGIDGVIANAQDRISIDSFKQKCDLLRRQGAWAFAIPLSYFQHIVKRQCICAGEIIQF